jgi:hypothetical protein
VNTSSLTSSGVAVYCGADVAVSSNIIAYNSTNPIDGGGCTVTRSLFDSVGIGDAGANASADVATFFVDFNALDFRLASSSPARGAGEPGLLTIDLDGDARPLPVGSMPDIGAFEAP